MKTRCTTAITKSAMIRLDVDDFGLDSSDRRYLLCIIDKFGGGPVGVETLCAALSEERDTIEEVFEPFLIQEGFVRRTPRGRVATDRARQHLHRAVPPGAGALL